MIGTVFSGTGRRNLHQVGDQVRFSENNIGGKREASVGSYSSVAVELCTRQVWRVPELGARTCRGEWKSNNSFCARSSISRAGQQGESRGASLATDSGENRDADRRTTFRILIADDHEAVRRGLRSALAGAGWRVCGEAVDGRDAIQKTLELKPDLLILDVSMPNVGGLEAAREILKSSKQTKILVFTMHESKQIRDETAAIGVHALAVKSAPLSTLLATIDSLFEDTE
jgi:CheY-like chemotaxis protein